MVHEVRYVSSATRLQQCPTKRPFDQAAQMVVLSPKHANPSRVAATVWNCSYSQCSRLLGRVVSVEFPMIFSLFIPRHHLLPNIFAIILEVFRKPETTGKTQRGAPPMWGCRGCDRLCELPCSFEELQGVELAAYPGYPVYTMPGMRRWQCSLSAFPACPSSRPTPSTRRGDPADQTMRCCPTASSLFMALDCWNSVQCDLWVRICILVVWKLANQKVNAFLTQKKHEKKVAWVNWSQYLTHTKWTSWDFHRLGFRHEPIPVRHGPRQTWQQEKFKNVFAWVTTNLFHGPGTFCNRPYLRLGKTTHLVM